MTAFAPQTVHLTLQTDPIGYADQMNLYAYVANDPVNATDPSGLVTRENAADLSKCVYDTSCNGAGGYERQDPSDYGLEAGDLVNSETGLQAAIFSNSDETVIAFAGTTPTSGADWNNNARQGVGLSSNQYESAARISQTVADNLGGQDLAFTGHSLGGGLAALGGAITGADTKTFNAAGVSNATLRANGVSGRNFDNITNYVTRGDILTSIQERSPAPRALGRQVYSGNRLNYFVPGILGVVNGVRQHGNY